MLYEVITAHLHSLRGSALSLGVTPLAQACKAAENRYLQDDAGRMLAVVIMVVGVALFLRLAQAIFRPQKIRYTCP